MLRQNREKNKAEMKQMINTRKSFIPEMGDIEKSLDISRTSVLGGLLDYIKGKNDERVVNTLNILK